MDDGGMVVALNDICFGDPGKSPVVTSTAQSPPSTGNRKNENHHILQDTSSPPVVSKLTSVGTWRAPAVGIIDPLCFHLMQSRADIRDKYDFSGFVSHLHRQIHSSTGSFTLLLPVQVQEGWNAAILTLRPPSSSSSRTASFFLFLGVGVPIGGEASASTLADKVEETLMVLVRSIPGCSSATPASSRAVLTSTRREAQGSAIRVLAGVQEAQKLGFSSSGPGEWTSEAQNSIKRAIDMDAAAATTAMRRVVKRWDELGAVSEKMLKAYFDKVIWKPGKKSTRL